MNEAILAGLFSLCSIAALGLLKLVLTRVRINPGWLVLGTMISLLGSAGVFAAIATRSIAFALALYGIYFSLMMFAFVYRMIVANLLLKQLNQITARTVHTTDQLLLIDVGFPAKLKSLDVRHKLGLLFCLQLTVTACVILCVQLLPIAVVAATMTPLVVFAAAAWFWLLD